MKVYHSCSPELQIKCSAIVGDWLSYRPLFGWIPQLERISIFNIQLEIFIGSISFLFEDIPYSTYRALIEK